jgi:hypothetical protein
MENITTWNGVFFTINICICSLAFLFKNGDLNYVKIRTIRAVVAKKKAEHIIYLLKYLICYHFKHVLAFFIRLKYKLLNFLSISR